MMKSNIIDKLAKELLEALSYKSFDPTNPIHRRSRDRILEKYNLLNEASILDDKYIAGTKLVATKNISNFLQKKLNIKPGDPVEIIDYDISVETYPNSAGVYKKTLSANGNKITITSDSQESYKSLFKLHKDSTISKGPDAEFYEMGIAVAYNMKQGMDEEKAIKVAEITGNNLKNFNQFKNELMRIGNIVAEKLNSGSNIKYFGSVSGLSNSAEWEGKNATPKTDLLGTSENLSLKMVTGTAKTNRIANPNKAEAISTIKAGLKYYNSYEKSDLQSEVDKIISEMDSDWQNVDKVVKILPVKKQAVEEYIPYRVEQLKKRLKRAPKGYSFEEHAKMETIIFGMGSGRVKDDKLIPDITDGESALKEFINNYVRKEGLAGKSEIKEQIAFGLEQSMSNRKWSSKLSEFFEKNQNYKKWIVFEAMTGQYKFTGEVSNNLSNAVDPVANVMLKVGDKSIGLYEKITPEFAAKYAKSVSTRVSFKHNKGAMFLEYKVLNETTGKISNLYDSIFDKQYKIFESKMTDLLNEEGIILEEGLGTFLKKSVKSVKGFLSKAWDKIKKLYDEFIRGILNNILNTLRTMAKNGYDYIMNAMGWEITTGEIGDIVI